MSVHDRTVFHSGSQTDLVVTANSGATLHAVLAALAARVDQLEATNRLVSAVRLDAVMKTTVVFQFPGLVLLAVLHINGGTFTLDALLHVNGGTFNLDAVLFIRTFTLNAVKV